MPGSMTIVSSRCGWCEGQNSLLDGCLCGVHYSLIIDMSKGTACLCHGLKLDHIYFNTFRDQKFFRTHNCVSLKKKEILSNNYFENHFRTNIFDFKIL